nr:hypothetical protein [Tanacetum cinerariifolium]
AAKGKQPARATSPTDPSEVERTAAEQLKIILRRSRQEAHISQHGGSGTDEGTDVDDQTTGKDFNEGKKTDESDADDDDQDETEKGDDDNDDDDEEEIAKLDEQEDTESGEGDAKETESDGESEEEETMEEEEESFDPIPRALENDKDEGNGEEDQGLRISEEERIQEEEEAYELYRDVDIKHGRGLQVSQDIKDSHVTLTLVQPDGQQESSSVSSFVTSMLNPTSDAGVESIFTTASSLITPLPTPTPIMTPSTIATITKSSEAPIPPTTIPSAVLGNLPTFDSVFCFEDRVKSLEVNFSEFMQTNQFAEAVSKILGYCTSIHDPSNNGGSDLTEMELKKILIEKMEGNKSIQRFDEQRNLYKALVDAYEADKTILESYGDTTILKRRRGDDDQEGPPAGSDRGAQTWISELAKQADSHSSFNELLDTPIDFSNFIMNRLGVDTLTPELLAGPTYELMRGSCTSLTKLEYHLEEVYKATTDQLDWVNPEGQQCPHNLLQPLSLIPDNRGRRVIPFARFINNDLEFLRGGTSSRKYTTSVTKTKAADYGHIKFAVNRESALDVYSKRRIIAVTDLKIVEWHNYKHLDWILVRRDDDKIYKFKEGDFKRLRLQDIEDMLLLLVQRKLSNLIVEERFAFNVSLRMFTRSIVIQ